MRSHAAPKKHQKSNSIISTGSAFHVLDFFSATSLSDAQQVNPHVHAAVAVLKMNNRDGNETCADALRAYLSPEFPFNAGELFCAGELVNVFLDKSHQDILTSFMCHTHGEFGLVTEYERVSNLVAIKTKQGRVASRYLLDNGVPYSVITEWVAGEPETTAVFDESIGLLRTWQ